jgi:hypothetical protein
MSSDNLSQFEETLQQVLNGLEYQTIPSVEANMNWAFRRPKPQLPSPWQEPLSALKITSPLYHIRTKVTQVGNTCGDRCVAYALMDICRQTSTFQPTKIDMTPYMHLKKRNITAIRPIQSAIRRLVHDHIANWSTEDFRTNVPLYIRSVGRDSNESHNDASRLDSLRRIVNSNESLNIAFFYILSGLINVAMKIIVHDMRYNDVAPQLFDINPVNSPTVIMLILSHLPHNNVGHFEVIKYRELCLLNHSNPLVKAVTAIAATWQPSDSMRASYSHHSSQSRPSST